MLVVSWQRWINKTSTEFKTRTYAVFQEHWPISSASVTSFKWHNNTNLSNLNSVALAQVWHIQFTFISNKSSKHWYNEDTVKLEALVKVLLSKDLICFPYSIRLSGMNTMSLVPVNLKNIFWVNITWARVMFLLNMFDTVVWKSRKQCILWSCWTSCCIAHAVYAHATLHTQQPTD